MLKIFSYYYILFLRIMSYYKNKIKLKHTARLGGVFLGVENRIFFIFSFYFSLFVSFDANVWRAG